MCRWKTMEGYVVERKAGWDCHGLPVEREVEKMLGFESNTDVKTYGELEFNRLCEESVWKFEKDWEQLTRRMGFWVDMENRYATLDQTYMESEWWALKQLWEKGLLRKGYKVLPYSPQTGCTYSNRDVSEGYREVTDLTCFVRFPLSLKDKGNLKTSLVAWTSTPWTLPANVLLAVNRDLVYVYVMVTRKNGRDGCNTNSDRESDSFKTSKAYYNDREVLVVAKSRLEELKFEWTANNLYELETLKEVLGSDLLDLRYEPPLSGSTSENGNLFKVVHADYVTDTAGTGVVHVAPMYGEDDHALCLSLDLDMSQQACQHVVGLDGNYHNQTGKHVPPPPLQGLCVTGPKTQEVVVGMLWERGLLFRAHMVKHDYPFCWRNPSLRLLYYAMDSWFVTMGDPKVSSRMQALNASPEVRFSPETVKHGRFGGWLKETKDWCLSRKRTWGCPLPVWECRSSKGGCGQRYCVGSREELESLLVDSTAVTLKDLDLHATQLDVLELCCHSCGNDMGSMIREPYVLDCWFDSGCAPFAQWHYPFAFSESKSPVDYNGSAEQAVDFVAEGQDQCRGWFYSLLCVSTTLFDRPAYKHCLSLGLLLDKNGHKMSKSRGNGVDPWAHFNEEGSDALRWYLVGMCAPWNPRRFDETMVFGSNQKFFRVLHNVAKWWQVRWDEFSSRHLNDSDEFAAKESPSVLDKWLGNRLLKLVRRCDQNFREDNFHLAVNEMEDFVNDVLSKTYVRLSRVHFQGPMSESDSYDLPSHQFACLCSLRRSMLVLCRLVAPVAPFYVDRLHRYLMSISSSRDQKHPKEFSVHLASWPRPDDFAHLENELSEVEVRLLQSLLRTGNVMHENGTRPGRLPLARGYFAALRNPDAASSDGTVSHKEDVALSDELSQFLGFGLNVSKMVLLKSQVELDNLLGCARTTSVVPNVNSILSRFESKADAAVLALKQYWRRGAPRKEGSDEESHTNLKRMDQQAPSETKKSKKQLKRERKEAMKKLRGSVKSFDPLTGSLADDLLRSLQTQGSLCVVSETGDNYEFYSTDFSFSDVAQPGFMVSLKPCLLDESGLSFETALVLDLSVGPAELSTYLFKEVTHCVQQERKRLEKSDRQKGGGQLEQVSMKVVVELPTQDNVDFDMSKERWETLLRETRADPLTSLLVTNPDSETLLECEELAQSNKMKALPLKGFGGFAGCTVYVSCTACGS